MLDDKNVEEMGFEEAMTELEGLVKQLERGDLNLESSLQVYEKAVALRERCKSILEQSERRVLQLIEGPEGVGVERFE
ncbi:MAG: exodeoxyribonuclease VII small subunit [Candidatus Methanomethylophilaceae archaeon]|jgi:exodeoxyribonuclease VII small subunit